MVEAPEQIGALVFVANPDYPYPFDVPKAPRFWMEEQTGALAAAVETYLRGEALTTAHRALLQLYLRQYLERTILPSDANRSLLLSQVEKVRTTHDIERFAEELAEWGVEPF